MSGLMTDMTEPRAGVVLEHGKVRMELVVTSAESRGELHQMRVTYQPHSDLPPSHIHPAQDETFEILDGEVEFILDGVTRVFPAPAVVEVRRGTVHQLHNVSDRPATVLWSTRPALRTGEFFLALHDAQQAGDIDRLVAVIEEYDDVFCLADHPV
jgi:quercetin dioxygenase-like cupin family protein